MYGQLYADGMTRFLDLYSHVTDSERSRLLPACPELTVREALAHVVAAAAAESAGQLTAQCDPAQRDPAVDARVGRSTAELTEEWHKALPAIRQIPPESGRWFVLLHHLLSHEADVRAALGAPQLPVDALTLAWPLAERRLADTLAPLGIVRLDLYEMPVDLGTDSTRAVPDVIIETSLFEAWRGMFGRRSVEQMASWVRTGDAGAFTALLPVCPPRRTELLETA